MTSHNTNASDPGKLDPTILLPGTVSYLDLVNPDKFGRKAPEPLSKQRVIEHLSDRGYRFSIDDDGDPVGVWDQNLIWFMFVGSEENFLQIRGRWHRKIAAPERLSLLQALNDWNRDKLWPKVFARAEEDSPEYLHVYAEISCDFSAGATNHQLHQAIDLALEGALMFFDSLGQSLPPSLNE